MCIGTRTEKGKKTLSRHLLKDIEWGKNFPVYTAHCGYKTGYLIEIEELREKVICGRCKKTKFFNREKFTKDNYEN
jgi:hypothetical protein